jgi:hypothetical protein
VSRQAEVRWIEGRILGDQLGRPLVRSSRSFKVTTSRSTDPLSGSVSGAEQCAV